MIPYDTDRIKQIMDESQISNSTYDKGKKLEDLACYLFEKLPGITIAKRNAMNQYDTDEIDVSIWYDIIKCVLNLSITFFSWIVKIVVVL